MSGVSSAEKDPKKFATSINQLYAGRSNAAGRVTLAASAASTTVLAPNTAPQSNVLLFAASAHAATALATTYVPTATVTNGQFIIEHANNTQTDRTFYWVALG